jgi:Uri superfamily endonuclease
MAGTEWEGLPDRKDHDCDAKEDRKQQKWQVDYLSNKAGMRKAALKKEEEPTPYIFENPHK